MIILDPSIESQVTEASMATRLPSLGGVRVGFLDNGKPMADVFMRELAGVFADRYGAVPLVGGKPDPSRVVSKTQLAYFASRCRAIVTGVGD